MIGATATDHPTGGREGVRQGWSTAFTVWRRAVETGRSGRLNDGRKHGQELLRRKLLFGFNGEWRMCLATRPLLIYLAGVLFPEGAVAGGRRSPLSFHSITSSARASQGRPNFEAESACGLEIDHQQELGGKGDRQLGRFGPPLESYRCTPRSGEQARHSPNRTTSALRAEAQAESRSMQATRR
jgi:hypothetical protein